ncbi:hypothetical protein ABZ876_27000 [Streptomyces sp. NPDC046931]|uniref:hypothetical protein n=1 Tax=Streptomyces sp. NPDC046931 TaxID=3154806 RepID=UPI0033DF2C9F
MCLAALTAGPGPVPSADAVAAVVAGDDGVEVTWAADGARSRVEFRPLTVALLR